MKHGDFSALAQEYSQYRPGYSQAVLQAALGSFLGTPVGNLRLVDVGAGTGIFSRALAAYGPAQLTAVEPNPEMRHFGMQNPANGSVEWREGAAEATGLPDGCADLVSMASAFHWPDFDRAVAEFWRILKPGGRFLAAWNTRFIEGDALLEEIESYLHEAIRGQPRVSSGRSEFTRTLRSRLEASGRFRDVLYLEGYHQEEQSIDRYMGLWRSVNDVRVLAGEAGFAEFLSRVEERVRHLPCIQATYQTRAWLAVRRD